jgi:hypothetical protein
MIELYPQIKALHVIAVLASGSLFLLRGLLVRAGRQALAMAMPLRVLAVVVDYYSWGNRGGRITKAELAERRKVRLQAAARDGH